MPTPNQLRANRENALLSTGPKTAAGKLISSRNATKHGFYGSVAVLPDEDKEEFLRLGRRLVSAYDPCGVLQEEAVRTIIETHWQLRRANFVDNELFQLYGYYKGKHRGVGTAFAQDSVQGNAFTKLTRYQTFLLRKLHVAEEKLQRLKAEAAKHLAGTQQIFMLKTPGNEVSSPGQPFQAPSQEAKLIAAAPEPTAINPS